MNQELQYNKVLSNDSSFQLVRTNPKLTGNVKLTVNESDQIWLNAIPANLELAKDDFSRFPIDIKHTYATNVYQFFKSGQTPNEIIFSLTEEVDVTKTSKNYKDQFDFSNYFSGIKYLASNKYEERLSYFAPLYLKNEIPNYFVVFKIKDPLNKPIDEIKTEIQNGQSNSEYIIDLFKKATIVKTFDLRESTKIGKFIRDYRFNVNFPSSPLTINFNKNQETFWNGIVVNSGVFGSKGELLDTQYQESTPLTFFEENITRGFERNGVIFPNILNLEFIFNDETSANYDFDRYIGFYVNSIKVSDFKLDLNRSYQERASWENTPAFKREYYDYEETTFVQQNNNGVIFPYYDLNNFNLSEFTTNFTDSNSIYFTYIKDKSNNFLLPKVQDSYFPDYSNTNSATLEFVDPLVIVTLANHGYETNDLIKVESQDLNYSGEWFITKISDSQFSYTPTTNPAQLTSTANISKEINRGQIRLSNTNIDLNRLFGPEENIFLQDNGFTTQSPGYSNIAIKILDNLSYLDSFKIYHPNGTRVDSIGKYDEYYGVEDYELANQPTNFYAYNDYDNISGFDVFYFNITGLKSEVAKAISGVINATRNRTFTAYPVNEFVFIKCNSPGDFDNLHAFKFNSKENIYSSLEINNQTYDLSTDTINFVGGSKFIGNRLIVDSNHYTKLSSNINLLLVKTETGWSRVSKISNYVDTVLESNITNINDRFDVIGDYNNKIVITLELNESPSVRYSNFLIKKKTVPELGIFSFFPIKDLDFDFISSTYLNFPQIDLYENYYVPSNLTILKKDIQYKVIGGSILFEGTKYQDQDRFTPALDNLSYTVISGDPIVSPYSDTTILGESTIIPIVDENNELTDFPGFSILKDPELVQSQVGTELFQLRDKFINGLTTTEYNFYKENSSTNFALKSKILPYINKWAIRDGFDSRNNPYRLNTEIVFGRNNFSPDHTDRNQNPDNFTHEWFYIESSFNYLNDNSTISQNNNYFDEPLDIDRLLSEKDYFINYFTYSPKDKNDSSIDIGPVQFRYSNIFKNAAGEYETFFKGFKISFKDTLNENVLDENNKPTSINQSNRFDNYKFSCILKPIKEEFFNTLQDPITYEVIEHKDFKFIIIVIKIAIGYLDTISDFWKSVQSNTQKTVSNILGDSASFFFADTSYTTEFGSTLPAKTILGDYRITFNDNNVSNLSYNLIYSLKNKKFNSKLNKFSNVKISNPLNITTPPLNQTIIGFETDSVYPILYSNEIIKPSQSKPILIADIQNNIDYLIDQFSGPTPQNENPIISSFSESVKYELVSGNVLKVARFSPSTPYTISFQSIPISSGLSILVRDKWQYYVLTGGEQYFERLFENISFNKFKNFINTLNPIIEYSSYSIINDVLTKADSPNFYMDIPDQTNITKTSQVFPVVDSDIPSQFSFINNVSYVFEQSQLNKTIELNRYNGQYEPISTDLLINRSSFIFNKNKIADIKLGSTRFNTDFSNLLTITNFNHIKVSNTKILTLESDDSFLPQYPKIGETAIGSANYFLLKGNWDWGFHYKWLNKTTNQPVSGTLRIEEDENFLGKILTVPAELELETFDLQIVDPQQNIELLNLNQIELVYQEKANSITGFINLNNVLTNYFIENNIANKFNEFLVNSNEFIGNFNSIDEYVNEYIKVNILKLYTIETIEFYKKRNALLVSDDVNSNPNLIEFTFLNDQERFRLGYSQIKNLEINKLDKLIIKFTINKDIDAGFNISPKIKIKFI